MFEDSESVKVLKKYELCWKVLGLTVEGNKYIWGKWGVYDILVTIFATIGFPLHLTIGLVMSSSQEELFKNLVINIAALSCTLKQITYRIRLGNMPQLNTLFAQLDAHIHHPEEQSHFRLAMLRPAKMWIYVCAVLFFGVTLVSMVALLISWEQRLVYPGYFPFDWQQSGLHYAVALCFQYFGLIMQTTQNYSNDMYGPVGLCLFSGHVHLLGIRISKIGHDKSSTDEENSAELERCIVDHQRLMRIFQLLQETISMGLFVQFILGGLNICVAVVYLIYFADSYIDYIYYTVHFSALASELFPCCYYGSLLEIEFHNLPYAIFSCNWLEQTRKFRKNLLVFAQLSLRGVVPYAGGMFLIHLTSFFATCKMAYSFFTLIISFK